MARRILNRRELRKQSDHAESVEGVASESEAGIEKKEKKPRAKKATLPRKPRAKKAPARIRARWGIFDGGMKQVAVFDYNQRAAADAKLEDLQTKKKGSHFLQIVKEPMPEPEVVEAAVLV